MPLFRALAKNMAPMTNADESPTNRLTLFPIYLSLFIVSTLWRGLNAGGGGGYFHDTTFRTQQPKHIFVFYFIY